MASVWITPRTTKSGKRYRVLYQLGGRGTKTRYAGSFKTKAEALERRGYIAGEIARRAVPDLGSLEAETAKAPTLGEATEAWRASRVDVVAQTGNMHRSALGRIWTVAPHLRSRRIDELTYEDVAGLIAALAAKPYKRETIKKTRDALAMALDFAEVDPNPARDKRVKLPKERKPHVPPPLAAEPAPAPRSPRRADWAPTAALPLDVTRGADPPR